MTVDHDRRLSRRTLLGAVAVNAAGGLLAACGGDAATALPAATPMRPPATSGSQVTAAPTTATSATGATGATMAPMTVATMPTVSTMSTTPLPAANYPPPLPAGTTVTLAYENYNLAAAGLGRDATQQLIDEFMGAHPQIKVEGHGSGSTELAAKVQAQVIAGNPPDVIQGLWFDLDFIVNDLKAVAMEDIAPPAELDAWRGGEYPMSPNGLKLATYNGKTYGPPYVISTPTLFYNADLLTMAGLEPAKPPTTWAETKQAALQIKQRTGKEGVFVYDTSNDFIPQALVRSSGGRVISDDRKTILFGQPEAVESVRVMQDLVQSGAHPTLRGGEITGAFQAGNLAMLLTTSASQSGFVAASKGKWTLKTAKMPAYVGKPAVPVSSGSGLFILSKNPLKQQAAWEMMRFMTSERAYTIITSKIGYLPLRPGIVNDDRYLKGWVAENPLVQPNLEQLQQIAPREAFPGPNYRQIMNLMSKAMDEVVFGGANPDTTMKAAQDRTQGLMPRR